jgi:DNA-binding Lrp family transcriptional regulator
MSESTTNPLDEIDREILAILQANGRLSGADIGRKVNLSQPAVSARIQRLERSGVITGYHAVVDPRGSASTSTPSSAYVRRTLGSPMHSSSSRRSTR